MLVTGGFGAIGVWLVRALVSSGEDVTVLARTDRSERLGRVKEHVRIALGDVRDADTVEAVLARDRISKICHLAADHGLESPRSPATIIDTNVTGTATVLESARRRGVDHFLLTSSKAVYGPPTGRHAAPSYEPVPEDAPLRPSDVYGATKAAAEFVTKAYADTSEFRATVLRFASTFGPGKQLESHGSYGTVTAMIEAGWRGKPFSARGGDQCSDYIYYGDVARGICLALAREGPNYDVFNIATGRCLTLFEIRDVIDRICGKSKIDVAHGERYIDDEPSMASVLSPEKARTAFGFSAQYTMAAAIEDFGRVAARSGEYADY